jgi:hypothetical protein
MLNFFFCLTVILLLIKILLKILPYMIVYVITLRCIFYPIKLVPINQQEVSNESHDALRPWIEQLSDYGFVIAGYRNISTDTFTKQPYQGVSL